MKVKLCMPKSMLLLFVVHAGRDIYAAVSASHMEANSNSYRPYGIIYLFRKNSSPTSVADTWIDTGRRYSSGVADDSYGASVSMLGNVLAVGAPTDTQYGEKNGAGTSSHTATLFPVTLKAALLCRTHASLSWFQLPKSSLFY